MVFLKAKILLDRKWNEDGTCKPVGPENMEIPELNPNLTVTSHEVGLSAERLERISATTQQFIDKEQLAGCGHSCSKTRQE